MRTKNRHNTLTRSLTQDDEDALYYDEEDRAKLMAMTELEREMELADRAEERDKIRQRKQLLKTTREAEESRQKVGVCLCVCLFVCG